METEEADGSFGGGCWGKLTVSLGQHVLAVVLQQPSEGGKTTTDTVTDRATD